MRYGLWMIAALLAAAAGPGAEHDIAYAPGGPAHTLDLQWPDTRGYATVLYVHEGGLVSGDKADSPYAAICANFVAQGMGCASTNYTLLKNGGRWPQPAEDVAAAFAWLKKNIASRGGDSSRIYVLGHSSGCQLASLLGTDGRYLTAHHLTLHDVAGVIALGCRSDNEVDTVSPGPRVRSFYEELYGSLSAANDAVPLLHVTAGMAPMLIMMGDAEQINPPILDDARKLAAKASQFGITVPIEVLPDRKHMTAMQGLARPDDIAFRRVMQFIKTGR